MSEPVPESPRRSARTTRDSRGEARAGGPRRPRPRRLSYLGAALAAAPLAAQPFPTSIALDSHFPTPGSTVEVSLSGPAEAEYRLGGSLRLKEVDLGEIGTLFIDLQAGRVIDTGLLDASGAATIELAIPAGPQAEGLSIYLQARIDATDTSALTSAVPLRIGAEPRTGPRRPVSIATTPGRARAYVLHQLDGALSILDTDTGGDPLVADLPIGPPARGAFPHRAGVAVDPDERRLYAFDEDWDYLAAFDLATESIAPRVPLPRGTTDIAFDFDAEPHRIYATNRGSHRVHVFEEEASGALVELAPLDLVGRSPISLALLPGGRLVVGHAGTHDLEVVDPLGASAPFRVPLGTRPRALARVADELWVATFRPLGAPPSIGTNEIVRFDLVNLTEIDRVLADEGTDYASLAAGADLTAIAALGTGTLIVADGATGDRVDRVVLAPSEASGGAPATTAPVATAVVTSSDASETVYVVNRFRETVARVPLGSGPPYAVADEISLAHLGRPRVPLVDLSPAEDGEWFFHTVEFFGGTPLTPNPVTCFSCHEDTVGNGLDSPAGNQVLSVVGAIETGPWGWTGRVTDLAQSIEDTGTTHSIFGTTPPPGATELILAFLDEPANTPISPFLIDGEPSPDAVAGRALFEGVAGCSDCHTAPRFIPSPPAPLTIADGVGTGLVPANVPSLVGVWRSGPYLHDGSAIELIEVLERDTGDLHGATSGLTDEERRQLVTYLQSL